MSEGENRETHNVETVPQTGTHVVDEKGVRPRHGGSAPGRLVPAMTDDITNQPVEEATGVQIIRRLERAVAVIRAEHAAKAAIAGSPCVCEWCRDAWQT